MRANASSATPQSAAETTARPMSTTSSIVAAPPSKPRVRADQDAVESDRRDPPSVHEGAGVAGEAGRVGLGEKERRLVPGLGGDQHCVGGMAVQHKLLDAVEPPASARARRRGRDRAVARPLVEREGDDRFAARDPAAASPPSARAIPPGQARLPTEPTSTGRARAQARAPSRARSVPRRQRQSRGRRTLPARGRPSSRVRPTRARTPARTRGRSGRRAVCETRRSAPSRPPRRARSP